MPQLRDDHRDKRGVDALLPAPEPVFEPEQPRPAVDPADRANPSDRLRPDRDQTAPNGGDSMADDAANEFRQLAADTESDGKPVLVDDPAGMKHVIRFGIEDRRTDHADPIVELERANHLPYPLRRRDRGGTCDDDLGAALLLALAEERLQRVVAVDQNKFRGRQPLEHGSTRQRAPFARGDADAVDNPQPRHRGIAAGGETFENRRHIRSVGDDKIDLHRSRLDLLAADPVVADAARDREFDGEQPVEPAPAQAALDDTALRADDVVLGAVGQRRGAGVHSPAVQAFVRTGDPRAGVC